MGFGEARLSGVLSALESHQMDAVREMSTSKIVVSLSPLVTKPCSPVLPYTPAAHPPRLVLKVRLQRPTIAAEYLPHLHLIRRAQV